MADYTDILNCYSGDTFDLMKLFIGRLKSEPDRRAYAEALRLFNEITGTDPLHASEDTFSRYVQELGRRTVKKDGEEKAWKHSTALKNRKIVASFIRYCKKMQGEGSDKVPSDFDDRLMYSPMRSPNEAYHFRDIISVASIDKLYCHLRDRGDYRLMCALIFSLRCFLRPANFIGCRFSDIYIDRSGEYFLEAKGRSAMVHIPADCVPFLEAYRASAGGDYLFGKARSSGPMGIDYLDGRLKKACRDAGMSEDDVGGFTFNALRNSATVYAVSNGATPEMMAEALDLQTPAHFTKLSSLTLCFDRTQEYVGITFTPGPGHDDVRKGD